jgi:hypothetical protein
MKIYHLATLVGTAATDTGKRIITFDEKWVGLHFGRFFYKRVWNKKHLDRKKTEPPLKQSFKAAYIPNSSIKLNAFLPQLGTDGQGPSCGLTFPQPGRGAAVAVHTRRREAS